MAARRQRCAGFDHHARAFHGVAGIERDAQSDQRPVAGGLPRSAPILSREVRELLLKLLGAEEHAEREVDVLRFVERTRFDDGNEVGDGHRNSPDGDGWRPQLLPTIIRVEEASARAK